MTIIDSIWIMIHLGIAVGVLSVGIVAYDTYSVLKEQTIRNKK